MSLAFHAPGFSVRPISQIAKKQKINGEKKRERKRKNQECNKRYSSLYIYIYIYKHAPWGSIDCVKIMASLYTLAPQIDELVDMKTNQQQQKIFFLTHQLYNREDVFAYNMIKIRKISAKKKQTKTNI